MKYFFILSLLFLAACGGKLSDEQRKQMRENMEKGEIKKITDSEITEAAFAYGRSIIQQIEKRSPSFTNKNFSDSVAKSFEVKIVTLQTGDSALIEIEKQLIEAYTSVDGAQLTDNIQRMGEDSILYTKPIMRERPDGSLEFIKAIGIRMPRKKVILSIDK